MLRFHSMRTVGGVGGIGGVVTPAQAPMVIVPKDDALEVEAFLLFPRLQRATMRFEDKTVNLSAGMAVTVEIKTGKRRVIESAAAV